MKKVTVAGLLGIFALCFLIGFSEIIIILKTNNKHTDIVTKIPEGYATGVLPGTKKFIGDSSVVNFYYQKRIDGTVELFKNDSITHVIISGDNSTKEYDEPSTMRDDLIRAGIPSDSITLDYAGFSTLDSVLRAKYIFGQDSIVFISQKFQNQRAIILGQHGEVSVFGYDVADYPFPKGIRIKIRERLARLKMWYEIWFNFSPTVLGEPVELIQVK